MAKIKNPFVVRYEDISGEGGILVFTTRREAVADVADWAARVAKDELDTFEWDPDDEMHGVLLDIIKSFERGDKEGAVKFWFEYQNDRDPNEKVFIEGPGFD